MGAWNNRPLENMQCGLVAHNVVAALRGQSLISRYDPDERPEDGQAATWGIDMSKEREAELVAYGLSATTLLARIEKTNPGWRWVKRKSGTSVPSPSIAHLEFGVRVGHYTPVVEAEADRVRLDDLYLQATGWIEADVFADQCSGYFLVPSGMELGPEFDLASGQELEAVFGRGSCPNFRDAEGSGDECKPGCGGMAVPAFDTYLAFLRLYDDPLPYKPLFGPAVDLMIQYGHRDFTDDNILSDTGNLGPNWKHGLMSYIRAEDGTVLSATSTADVRWINGASFNTYDKSGAVYVAKYQERPGLYWQVAPSGFILKFSDGGKLEFTQPNITGAPTRYYLTKITDAFGLAVTITYIQDGSNRINYVTDAAGTVTKFLYQGAGTGLKIAHMVTEYDTATFPVTPQPAAAAVTLILAAHRHADFSYDPEGRLQSITDCIGLVSSFTYDDFDLEAVNKLTTPYGDTTFEYTGYPSQSSGTSWALSSRDPAGLVRRIESKYHDSLTSFGSGNNKEVRPVPEDGTNTLKIPVGSTDVTFLSKYSSASEHNHVTLEWNAKQWREYEKAAAAANPPYSPDIDPRKYAQVTLWAMNGSQSQTISVPLARKVPGQSAEFYNIKDQTDAFYSGTSRLTTSSSQAGKTARRVEGSDVGASPVWSVTQQTYGTTGRSAEYTDELGRKFRYTYATNNQDVLAIQSVVGAAATNIYTFSNYAGGIAKTVTHASGVAQDIFQMNSKAQPEIIQIKNGTTILQKYKLTYDTDGVGGIDGLPGYLVKVEKMDPLIAANWVIVDQATYDSLGRVATHTDAAGYVRVFQYDDMDRVTQITHTNNLINGAASTEQFVYYLLDQQSVKDRAGLWTHTIHDKVRRPILNIDPANQTTRYEWCSCGSLSKLIDPAGRVTEWKRDIMGRVTEKIMPDGVTKTTYTYEDLSGRLKTVKRPKDQGTGFVTVTFYYNKDGSLKKQDYTDLDTPDIIYHYTAAVGSGAVDPLGRLTFVEEVVTTPGSPPTVVTSLSHKLNYRVLTAGTDGAGQLEYDDGPFTNDRVQNVYDLMDRVSTEKLIYDAAVTTLRSEAYTWDNLGRLKTVINDLGGATAYAFGYNTLLDRPDTLTGPNTMSSAFSYKADSAGASARSLGAITHSRNATLLAGHTYGYDPAGRLSTWDRSGVDLPGIRRAFSHNLKDELMQEQTLDTTTNAAIDGSTWGLDDGGNWKSRTRLNSGVLQTRTYDLAKMNRLTQIGGNGTTVIEGTLNEFAQVTVTPNAGAAQTASVIRDPAGTGYRYRAEISVAQGTNTVAISATDQSSLTTNHSWQFTVPALSRSLTYDANGNTLNDGLRSYTWDAKDRLRTVTKGATTWKWDYDYLDRRIREYENNVLTKLYIWSGTQLIQQRSVSSPANYTAGGTVTRTYYDGGWLEGYGAAAPKYFTTKDHLGSIHQVVDVNGKLRARHEYDAYGAQVAPVAAPPKQSNLQVWLRADTGVFTDGSNNVTEWRNWGYANNNSAVAPVAAARPVLVANTLNGRPVIRFDGSNDVLEAFSGTNSLTGDVTVFVVHRRSAATSDASPMSFAAPATLGTNNPASESSLSLAWRNAWNSPSQTLTSGFGVSPNSASAWTGPRVDTAPDAVGDWQISTLVKAGTEPVDLDHAWEYGSQFRSDVTVRNQSGSHLRQNTKNNFTQTYYYSAYTYALGRRTVDSTGTGQGFLQGDIAEVLIYQGALSGDEQQQVEEYLGLRHGLTQDKPSDMRYTGHLWHEGSGLNLALYRAYDAELGRWISEDPIGEEGGLNLYGYVGNSPVMAVDLLGLRPLTECEKKWLAPYIPKVDLDNADLLLDRGRIEMMGVRARTIGNRIKVRAGEYNSKSPSGLALLAHELYHVGQYRQKKMSKASYVNEARKNGFGPKNKFEKPAYELDIRVELDLLKKALEGKFKGCP
ncbi:MAG: RHS repeat-associated core domain-containing protein [Prosthecobacter sp.]